MNKLFDGLSSGKNKRMEYTDYVIEKQSDGEEPLTFEDWITETSTQKKK